MFKLSALTLSTVFLILGITLGGSPAASQSNEALLLELRRLNDRMTELEAKVKAAEERAITAEAKAKAVEENVGEARAATVASGDTGVRLSLSGQVNRGLLFYDDGRDNDLRHVDNDNSSTRIRLIGEADVSDEVTIGSNIEVQFESNSSSDVQQGDGGSVITSNSFTERKLEIYLKHDRFGQLSVGQGDTASNGTSEVDLSGTTVVSYSGQADVGGSLLFRDRNTDTLTGIELGDTLTNFDGLSRDDRIRYDTPTFGGFKASVSVADDDEKDVALRYNNSFGGFRLAAAASYVDRNGGVEQYSGSFSALHSDTGLSVTGAAGSQSRAGEDPFFLYGKLGLQRKWFGFGKTAFSLDTYYAENINVAGDDTFTIGAQAVQSISSVGTELYLGGRLVNHDTPGQELDDVFTVFGGARVKF